ncbi:MAG: starch-binding protein, partial [Clostridia bacterium]|nr:starch-binding protein [Clostridia bacterium]
MNKKTQSSRFSVGSKVASVFLSAALLTTTFTGLGAAVAPLNVQAASSSTNYLVDNQQDGSILQCFNWSFNAIKEKIPQIAEQGFTAVQTSPIQTAKEGTSGKTAKGSWWVQYQPADFTIETNANGTGALGTAAEFKAMCDEAHKYGVRVIVDAVLNHMANQSKNDLSPTIPAEYRNNSSFWHDIKTNSWYKTRYDITQYCMDGVPDLNTGNQQVQEAAIKFLKECIDCGADGFRFDGAKHIETPADSTGSQFWPNVLNTTTSYAQSTKGITPYYYGEVLDKTTGDDDAGNGQNIVNSYTSYMSITLSSVSNSIRNAVNGSNAEGAKRSDFNLDDGSSIKGSRAVLWNESHDTYQAGTSNYVSDYNINKTWALVGTRAEACGMYLARPSNWNTAMMGQGDTTAWANTEVKAVNLFNNSFVGQTEYLSSSGSVAYNERGTAGVVLVNMSGGSTSVSVPSHKIANGTYTDQITGSTFTVSNGTISGNIGNTGIAVVYNAQDIKKGATVSAAPGDSSFTSSVTATLNVTGATSGSYQTSDGQSGTYTNGKTITFGSSTSVGSSVTLTLSATGEDGKTATAKYTYTKVDPNAVVKAYFDNSGYNWSNVYAYVYDGSGTSVKEMAAWPGVKLTEKNSAGYYVLDVNDYKGTGRIIFSDGTNSADKRYPGDNEPGLEIGNTSMKFSTGNKWEAYSDTPVIKDPTVTSDKASGTSFTAETLDITLTLANATKGTYSVDGGPTKEFTGSKTVTIGEGKIGDSTVTVETTAVGSDGTKKSYTFTYEKKYVKKTTSSSASLASYYSTNKAGVGKNKTIKVDGDLSDWDSSMLIAQGTANDDPRVYRPNSMYEVGVDLYALYGAYDDSNLYLMWEMTNVQDVVAPNDNYPLSQGTLWQTQEFPFFIAIDTGKSSDAIGNKGQLTTGGTIWGSGLSFKNSFNRLISINTKGGNGPFVYSGDSTGLNPVEILNATTSKISMKYGKGILSKNVYGINGAYGVNNNRVVGDMTNESAAWVDFNTKGHDSASMDFFYEMSIPLSELGITKSDIESNGIGVLLLATMGKSALDCLPYDLSMNDNADLDDSAGSQENNSFEKSDEDYITTAFARIGKNGTGGGGSDDTTTPLQVNFGTDKSAPQLTTTALTLKAIGYGGTAPYKYEFSVDNTVVKASNTTATYTWKPGTSGKHTIKCVITDATGKTATVSKTFTAEGTNTNVLTNSTTVSKTSFNVGEAITVKGAATGGSGTYTYEFYYKRSTATAWTKFGSTTTATFKPSSAGTFNIRVYAKDNAGASAVKDFTVTAAAGLVNNTTVSKTSFNVGEAITVKGAATGGSGIYTY